MEEGLKGLNKSKRAALCPPIIPELEVGGHPNVRVLRTDAAHWLSVWANLQAILGSRDGHRNCRAQLGTFCLRGPRVKANICGILEIQI